MVPFLQRLSPGHVQIQLPGSEVLDRINEARWALTLPLLTALPNGSLRRAQGCPLSRALNAVVSDTAVAFSTEAAARQVARAWHMRVLRSPSGLWTVPLPMCLVHFVREFDRGHYPALVSA